MRTGRGLLVETVASRAAGRPVQSWGLVGGATETARLILSGENVNIHFITDSKLASPMNQHLITACTQIPWGGTLEQGSYLALYSHSGAWVSQFWPSFSGDERGTPIDGHYVDEVGLGRNVHVQFSDGVNAPANSDAAWMAYVGSNPARYPLMYARAVENGPGMVLCAARRFGAISQGGIRSSGRTYVPSFFHHGNILSLDDSTQLSYVSYPVALDGVSARCAIVPSISLTGGAVGINGMVNRVANGVTCFSWGVGGSTVNRWVSDVTFSEAHRQLCNAYDDAMGSAPVYWIELGTNWIIGETQQEYADKLRIICAKIKASTPNVRFVFSTGYPDGTSTPGGLPPWWAPMQTVASEVDALVIDTFQLVLPYADALAAGYFTPPEIVHYNVTGRRYLSGVIGAEMLAKAA